MFIGLKEEKLLWMAGEITLARRRIREAVHLMQHGQDKEFFAGCYRFEKEQFKQFDTFYLFESPEFLSALRQGDHDAIGEALLFLEADPYCFRSGYIKKKLCRALKQAPLTRMERFRIRQIVLRAVCIQRPVSFRAFAALGAHFYTPGFHARAEKLKIIPVKYMLVRKKLLLQKLTEESQRRRKMHIQAPPAIYGPVSALSAAEPSSPRSFSLSRRISILFSFFSGFRCKS